MACTTGGGEQVAPLPPLPPRLSDGAPPAEAARPVRPLVIAWSAEVRGEIAPCGCPTTPYGGMERRARLLDLVRDQGAPVFHLDAGDLLVKGQRAADQDQRARRARLILDLLDRMGLDAWAPSPEDRVPGLPHGGLSHDRALSAGTDLPGARVVARGGIRLGVIGLARQTPDPVAAVAAARASLAADPDGPPDLWVLLSNAGPEADQAVAAASPWLGLILATPGEAHDPPRLAPGLPPVLEAPDRGRYLSLVHAWVGADPGPVALRGEGSDLSGGPWQQAMLDRRMLRDQLAQGSPPEVVAATRARLDARSREIATATAGYRFATVEQIPLGSNLDPAPENADADIAARLLRFEQERLAAAQSAARSEAPAGQYVSAAACLSCHRDRFSAWVLDPHARALDALRQREQERDPECIGCHTTGFGAPGGFGTPDDAALSRWKGVQCEACHGPLSAHPDGRDLPPVTAAACTGCHDPANSPQFDPQTYLRRISCTMVSAQGKPPSSGTHP